MNPPLFTERFQLVLADTDERRDACFRLRHTVYCEERGFADPQPDQRERDDYDDQSVHVLLRERQTGEYVGTARLIRPSPYNPTLPIETTYGPEVSDAVRTQLRVPRNRIAEISRLVVRTSKLRTNRPHIVGSDPYELSGRGAAMYPPPLVGLCLAMFAIALKNDVTHLLGIVEPRLCAYFAKLGTRPQTIGPTTDYRGLLVPFLIHPYQVVGGFRSALVQAFDEIWHHLYRSTCPFTQQQPLAANA